MSQVARSPRRPRLVCRVEEHSGHDDAVRHAVVVEVLRGHHQRDLDLYMPDNVVLEVGPSTEIGDGLSIENRLRSRIHDRDRLRANVVVPIDEVKRQLMLQVIGKVHIYQQRKTALRISIGLVVSGADPYVAGRAYEESLRIGSGEAVVLSELQCSIQIHDSIERRVVDNRRERRRRPRTGAAIGHHIAVRAVDAYPVSGSAGIATGERNRGRWGSAIGDCNADRRRRGNQTQRVGRNRPDRVRSIADHWASPLDGVVRSCAAQRRALIHAVDLELHRGNALCGSGACSQGDRTRYC